MDIELRKIERLYDGGAGNMGTVETETSPARFEWRTPWLLLYVRVNFHAAAGATPSGVADMAMVRHDDTRAEWQDVTMYTAESVGTGVDVNFRILADEYPAWVFHPPEQLVLTWTNPDADNLLWGAEVGLYPLG